MEYKYKGSHRKLKITVHNSKVIEKLYKLLEENLTVDELQQLSITDNAFVYWSDKKEENV